MACGCVTGYTCGCVTGYARVMCVYRLLDVRTRLYDLLKHCIPPEIIFKVRCVVLSVLADVQLTVLTKLISIT